MSCRAWLLLCVYVSIHVILLFPLFSTSNASYTAPAASSAAHKEKVLHLDDGNFDETVAEGETLVDFFAPWCPHCVALKPLYYQLAEILSVQRPQLKVAMLDCVVNPQTAKEQGIRAFPTIELMRNGHTVAQYQSATGELSVQSLLDFVARNAQTPLANSNAKPSPKSPNGGSASTPAGHSPSSSPSTGAGGVGNSSPKSPVSSSSTANSEFSRMVSDFFSIGNPEILKQLLLDTLSAPRSIFQSHPLFVLGCFYLFGLLNGLFLGIIYALRERRNAGY